MATSPEHFGIDEGGYYIVVDGVQIYVKPLSGLSGERSDGPDFHVLHKLYCTKRKSGTYPDVVLHISFRRFEGKYRCYLAEIATVDGTTLVDQWDEEKLERQGHEKEGQSIWSLWKYTYESSEADPPEIRRVVLEIHSLLFKSSNNGKEIMAHLVIGDDKTVLMTENWTD